MSINNWTEVNLFAARPAAAASSSSATQNPHASEALQAVQQQEERTAKRIQELEEIIANSSLGVVSRTKAKVELALLKKDDDHKQSLQDEIATIKGGVSKTKQLVEGNIKRIKDREENEQAIQSHLAELHTLALQRQQEARLRSEEHQKRLAEAEAALRDAEREAEEFMAKAKAAMMKLNEARKRVGDERRLFKEAKVEEETMIKELERLAKEQESNYKGDGQGENGNSDGKVEGMDGEMVDNSVEDEQLVQHAVSTSFDDELAAMKSDLEGEGEQKEELSRQITLLEATVHELRAVNKLQQGKIKSLQDHIEKSGETQLYWKEQSTKLSNELSDIQQRRKAQEEELDQLKSKMAFEDMQLENLMGEIQELKEMKNKLESKLVTADEKEKAELQALKDEVIKLVTEKENAVHAVQAIKESYEKSIKEREVMINELQQDVDVHYEELQQAEALLDEKEALASDLRTSIEQLQSEKEAQEKANLTHAQAEEACELEKYKAQVSELEKVNEDQRVAIDKMKKLLLKKSNMKEAFMVQDREIQRLSSSLATETEKAEKLSEEVAHWKDSATELSKSVYSLEQKRGEMKKEMAEMQSKLSKRIFKLHQEVAELKKAKKVHQEEANSLRSSLTKKVGISSSAGSAGSSGNATTVDKIRQNLPITPDSSLPGVDLDDKVENAVLEEILGRVLAQRDQLQRENNLLKSTNKIKEHVSEARGKEIAALNKKLSELAAEKERLLRELNATPDDKRRNEYATRLQTVEAEKEQLAKKLDRLSKGPSSANAPSNDSKDAKPPLSNVRSTIYSLSCKDCNDDLHFIGTTKQEIKYKVREHCDELWEMIQRASEKEKNGDADVADEEEANNGDFTKSDFAKHFVRHCRNARTCEEVLEWCAANIRVQRHTIQSSRQEGTSDNLAAQTVYQISCKACDSKLNYMGSTHENLTRKVIQHYNDVWQIVQKEYSEGFCEDASESVANKGKFGSSGYHFAKHCRHAGTKKEVSEWFEKNVKVEKYVMVCRTCLGTAIDTNQNNGSGSGTRRNSDSGSGNRGSGGHKPGDVVSFKVPS